MIKWCVGTIMLDKKEFKGKKKKNRDKKDTT